MFKTPTRFPALWIAVTMALAVTVMPAGAQQPTDEQRGAIRSSCRSDYMAHCASVPPGGLASLQCLQQNTASLSAACKSAVNAVAPSNTAPKAEPAPTKAETPKTEPPKTEAAPAKSETPKAAPAPAKTEAAPAREPKPSAAPKTATTPPPKAATAKPAVPAAKPATAAPETAPPAPLVLRPMRPLEELAVLRSACGVDARVLCGNVQPGGGRIIQCLASQPASLSPGCTDVLGQFAAQ